MYGGSIIAWITGVWALYKLFYANKVVGKVVEIKPFRKKSGLLLFGKLELKVEKLIKLGDDNINKKKAVVCHVKAGHSLDSSNKTRFIGA